ncbi:PRC-barrel domain-containing protein [Kallotenue papyrolyticum]|uniref:PRC-barrel domain-containing protein n=1 Tax=Kallotenue papyrolyticum TaxID=1325125 RepID=UPI0004785678|nr:PRC-barrel domain-containing protein [Kallotenue papyrolyticum]
MRKAKEVIGKRIIHQTTGAELASVHDIIFDAPARRAVALLVERGGWFREARVVPWTAITGIGDVIMVSGEQPIVTASEIPELRDEDREIRLTGLAVMNEHGDRIGTVGDLYINDAGEVIGYEVKQGFMSSPKFLFADSVKAVGRDAVIADTSQLTSMARAREEAHLHQPAAPDEPPLPAATTVEELAVAEPAPTTDSAARESIDTTAADGRANIVEGAPDETRRDELPRS